MSTTATDKPRIGIPWRTLTEERTGERRKLDYYFAAVRQAGGEPGPISLQPGGGPLERQVEQMQGFVLPGSPADVEPARYGARRHAKTANADAAREGTDSAILKHALATGKPVLAICFGCQILNVYLGGTLIQDIRSERPGAGAHGATDLSAGARGDLEHWADFETGSRLARLAGGQRAEINSSHHQAIDRPGEGLAVTARSDKDGIIEGVEWTGGPNWVTGVQWHPERMAGDGFAARLFADFVDAVRQHAAMQAGVHR